MAELGLNALVKIDISSTFTTVSGVQTNSLAINRDQVDITSQTNTNRWRALLEGAPVRSAVIACEGVFNDDAVMAAVFDAIHNGTHVEWQYIIPNFRMLEGVFAATGEWSASHNAEVRFSLNLESAGTLTVTTIA